MQNPFNRVEKNNHREVRKKDVMLLEFVLLEEKVNDVMHMLSKFNSIVANRFKEEVNGAIEKAKTYVRHTDNER